MKGRVAEGSFYMNLLLIHFFLAHFLQGTKQIK